MKMRTHDGREFAVSYNEMWEDEARWQLQFRCKICPDALGDLADVSVADVWPGGKPDTEGLGFNGFIARTRRGLELMEDAIAQRDVVMTHPLGYDGLEQAQGAQMRKKQALIARLKAMRDFGTLTPEFSDLRLDVAAAMMSDNDQNANYQGMLDRLGRGDNREPPP